MSSVAHHSESALISLCAFECIMALCAVQSQQDILRQVDKPVPASAMFIALEPSPTLKAGCHVEVFPEGRFICEMVLEEGGPEMFNRTR